MGFVNLTALDGNTIPVQADEVTSLRPIPTNLLPAAIAAGTFVDHESGARYLINGTVAATLALINAAGGLFATFTDLDGNTVHAAPALVSGILTLPTSVLPSGVANGASIEFDQATALKVATTAALAATALAAAGVTGGILAIAKVAWAAGTPSFDDQQGFTGAIIDNGAGDCTLTLNVAGPVGEAVPVLTPNIATFANITFVQPSGSTIRVTTFDATGAALDNVPFTIVVHVIGS